MYKKYLDMRGFKPFGVKVREQTIPLSDTLPVPAEILLQTKEKIVFRAPTEGGGILLAGDAGLIGGGEWDRALWMGYDVYYPQPDMYALALATGFYRAGQDIAREMPYVSTITGAFPYYPTRISYDFKELQCGNGFLPRTPGKLKTVEAGRPMVPGEIIGLYFGGREQHTEQIIEISNLFISETEPDYPMPRITMVDTMGQWAQKEWPGKSHSPEEVTERLRAEYARGAADALPNRTVWGGLATKRLTSGTGYFATHKDEQGKWWLTDPDGYAYIVMAVEGVNPNAAGVVDEWADSYAWLPEKTGEFAEAWNVVRSDPSKARRVKSAETVDFMKINLIRAFGADWKAKWGELTQNRLNAWGINNTGNSCGRLRDEGICTQPSFFFMGRGGGKPFPNTTVPIFRDFPDVFHPEYQEKCAEFAEGLENIRGRRDIVGYFMVNEPEWTFIIDLEISEMLLAHPAPLASKDVFIDFMRRRYGDIAAVNAAWDLSFSDFADFRQPLADATKRSPAAAKDLNDFSRVLITEYVRVPAQACKAYDPHHLNCGLRYPYIAYPNLTCGAEYLDVFDINDYRYDPKPYITWLSSLTDKPILVSEFHHGSLDRGLPVTGIRGVRTQEERGVAYRYYMEQAASCPAFLGSVYFTLNDQPILCNAGQENYNIGFVDITNRPHTEITDALRQTAENIYAVHDGSRPPYDRAPDWIPLNAH